MRNSIVFFVILAFLTAVSACQGSTLDSGKEFALPDTTVSVTKADLKIGPMDTFQVEVFGVPDLNGAYQVDFEGNVKMPLIGTIPVLGMSAGEIAFDLQERYGETYLQDPDVNVTITESSGRRVTVDGSVRAPGLYDVRGNLTLLQAVTLAGGPSEGANPRRVVIFRQIEGERHAAAFNLLAIRSGDSEDPRVYGNDIIIMDGSEARQTYGELLRSLPMIAFFMAF